jgi:hypothetical protein
MTVVSPASNAVAPTVPNVSYICEIIQGHQRRCLSSRRRALALTCVANNGNTAAKAERINELPASADAAKGRYVATKNVNEHVKM